MYVIHRVHTDESGSVIYSIFEGTATKNLPITTRKKAEIRQSEILWSALRNAQHNFINYDIEENAVRIHYGSGPVLVTCTILTVNK